MPQNQGFKTVPAEVSIPVQIACPFCKWNANVWLLHTKCGVNGRKTLDTLSDQIRWHVLGTHQKYNESLPNDAPDKIDPQVFERLETWNKKRRNWSDPKAIWREMYAAIADLDPKDPTIPDPDWTEEWVRSSINPGSDISAIEDRIADVKVRFEVRGLVQEIKHARQRKDERIAMLRTTLESAVDTLNFSVTTMLHAIAGLNTEIEKLNNELDYKVFEIETTSNHEIKELQDAIRNKLKLAPTQKDMLSEVGSFMGESGNEDANPQATPRPSAAQAYPDPTHEQAQVQMATPANVLDLQSSSTDTEMADTFNQIAQPYNSHSQNSSFVHPHGGVDANTPIAAFSLGSEWPGTWGDLDMPYALSAGTAEFSSGHVPSAADFSHDSETDTNNTSFFSQPKP